MKTRVAWMMAASVLMGMAVQAKQVGLNVSLSTPVVEAGVRQTAYLKVGLTGFELPHEGRRTPVNIALVIDKSGSMQGQKIDQAKQAALFAINRLDAEDIVSVLAYDDEVEVLVPSTKAANRQQIRRGIESIQAEGSTALFAGVSKGAAEVRKFLDRNRVNRVILLSDGQANVGPDTPGALGDLGASLQREGISVTTIGLGLGYNEDLMMRLAAKSDGNHAFVENSRDLPRIFDLELGDVLSVVAQEVNIHIHCRNGVRPVKVLGREADIRGDEVVAALNQLYSTQEKFVMLEVELPAGEADQEVEVASVDVSYANMATQSHDKLSGQATARYAVSKREVEKNLDKDTMAQAVMQQAAEVNKQAVSLNDMGRTEEAQRLLMENGTMLRSRAAQLDSDELSSYAIENEKAADELKGAKWQVRRKQMRDRQYEVDTQQSY